MKRRFRSVLVASLALASALACAEACSSGSSPNAPADGGSVGAVVPDGATQGSDAAGNETDGGGDAGVDSSDAAFAPADLDQNGKLALWLEATSASIVTVDGGVAMWKDSSKNHNDATGGANAPSIASAAANGHDAVLFTGLNSLVTMSDATSLQFGTQQVYIVAVTRVSTLRSFWFWKATADSGTPYTAGLQFFAANGGSIDGGVIHSPIGWVDNGPSDSVAWGTAELDDGKFHIVALRRTNPTTLEVAVDDVAPRSQQVTAVDVSAAGQPAGLGAAPLHQGEFGPSIDMSIAEEIILHDATGVVADDDVASVHAYLKAKYAL